jgi:AcrR family transcriptional regulator
MSNNSRSIVRNAPSVDPRVSRSTLALGAALVELMLDASFKSITVQKILDRAGIARSTFYAHFRNKHDVLHSSHERMFGWLEQSLNEPSSSGRIVPATEFLTHIAESGQLVDSLRSSGQLDEMSDLSVGYFANMIERRIRPLGGTRPSAPPALIARMLAGALMEMIKWWDTHRSTATAAQMDATFHALARTFLLRASYEVGAIELQGVVGGHRTSAKTPSRATAEG